VHAGDLQILAGFLARRDVPTLGRPSVEAVRPLDMLVLCGSAVLTSADVAAAAFHDGVVPRILVSGGVGHSTSYLRRAVRDHPAFCDVATASRSEASVLGEILRRHLDVPAEALTIEEASTNCGENAEFSLRLLARWPDVRATVVIQDPTMQRRTHASFEHWLRFGHGLRFGHDLRLGHGLRDGPPMEVLSYAPFVPRVGPDGVGDGHGPPAWSLDRFTSLALGELRRLQDDEHGYGPRGTGFIDHVDIPDDVLAAYRRLAPAD
jgi:hypothetical protein